MDAGRDAEVLGRGAPNRWGGLVGVCEGCVDEFVEFVTVGLDPLVDFVFSVDAVKELNGSKGALTFVKSSVFSRGDWSVGVDDELVECGGNSDRRE